MTAETGNYIGNQWLAGEGPELNSKDPSSQSVIWQGKSATEEQVQNAVVAARGAFAAWSSLDLEKRTVYIQKFKKLVIQNRQELAELISRETGKPLWESLTEADATAGKVNNSLAAHGERSADAGKEVAGALSATRYKPHGVVSVLGPFNLPAHLPGAHIVPALLAGNTVVFKPSDQTPAVGELLTRLWQKSGIPQGVFNLVQGAKETGQAMVSHPDVNGVFFTGSLATGRAINIACAPTPGKIVALELGGNNPLVVWDAGNVKAAVYLVLQSAFITAGQRCVCAGRLILPKGENGDAILSTLIEATRKLTLGSWQDKPEPFLGPLISVAAADTLLESHTELEKMGGKSLIPLTRSPKGDAYITPGIMDVTEVDPLPDVEYFGPFLQVIRVKDFKTAIEKANDTQFGLSAGLISDSRELWDEFYHNIRAGIVNWNRQITGAVGSAPFGGIGNSGNHRPSASFAADYCSYPVASIEKDSLGLPEKLTPGIEL